MSIDPYIVLGSALVGFLVGMTGAGGGALMTPMLILFFGVKPSTAISSDLVAAVLMRPVGAVVHMTKKTVNYALVGFMVLGSVPAAILGAYVLHLLGNSKGAENNVQLVLGAALLVGALAMVVRYALDRRSGHVRRGLIGEVIVRPLPTVAIGAIGGFIVGMTSVGSGSLMIVLLLFLYPDAGRQPAGRDGPDPGGAPDACGGPGRAGLRPRRVRRDDLHRHRQRPRRIHRRAASRPGLPTGTSVQRLRS